LTVAAACGLAGDVAVRRSGPRARDARFFRRIHREGIFVINSNGRLAELRELVAEVLEVDTDELTDGGDFVEEYEADSLRAIEILARIEKRYRVEIPQSELAVMRNLAAVDQVLSRYAGG
jgi:acyl carrier protein